MPESAETSGGLMGATGAGPAFISGEDLPYSRSMRETSAGAGSAETRLRECEVDVLDCLIDFRVVLVAHGDAVHACIAEGEFHGLLAIFAVEAALAHKSSQKPWSDRSRQPKEDCGPSA